MDLAGLKIGCKDGELLLSVHARPKSKRSEVRGLHGDALDVAVAAPPVDGAANDEIVRTLAKALHVPKKNVRIARGETGREKVIGVRGMTEDALRLALAASVVG